MHIGLDVSQMVYQGHGVGRYIEGLARTLLTHQDHSYTFLAGALRKRGDLKSLSQQKPWGSATWHLPPLPPRLARLVWNYTNLPVELVIGPVDLFHSSDWAQPYSLVPSVTTVHDLAFLHYPETVDPLVKATQTKRLARVIAFGTHILADSHSTKSDLVKYYPLNPSRITVVYPGIESHFKPQKTSEIERVKKKYKLPTQYLLALGTKEPRKNLSRLVQAVAGLDLPLVVTGRRGWGDALPSSPNVLETGYVDDADLPGLYAGASVFAYPSLYEGFGYPLVEAMACGTPCVTSQVSSLPEVAGEAAILVDPLAVSSIRKGLERALHNAPGLKKRGLLQAQKFSWDGCATATIKVYEQIYATNH